MLKSVGSNWALNLAQIAVGFVLPPLLIHTLGTGEYGEWLNVVALTGYLTLLLLGVPMATVREFTQHIANKDQERLNRSIASALWLYVVMGVAACVAGFIFYAFFVRVYVPKIAETLSETVASQARAAFVITVLQLAFGFVSQVPAAIMTAHRDFLLRNSITIGGVDITREISTTWRNMRRSASRCSDSTESEARSRSRSDTTPTSSPPCTTGMCRTRPRRMISSTIESRSLAEMVTSLVSMMSRTRSGIPSHSNTGNLATGADVVGSG